MSLFFICTARVVNERVLWVKLLRATGGTTVRCFLYIFDCLYSNAFGVMFIYLPIGFRVSCENAQEYHHFMKLGNVADWNNYTLYYVK